MAVVLPFLYVGWVVHYWDGRNLLIETLAFLSFVAIEYVVGRGAVNEHTVFITRAKHILEEGQRIVERR